MDLVTQAWCLLLTSMSLPTVHVQAVSNSTCRAGRETQYVLAFLAPELPTVTTPDDLVFRLHLHNPSSAAAPANVTVDPAGLTLSLPPGVVNTDVVFNGSAALVGSMKQAWGGGLLVTACSSDDVEVEVRGSLKTRQKGAPRASAAFSVPPSDSLGVDYVVVTHCEKNHCFVGIVATQPDTSVNITLRLRHSYDVTINSSLDYEGQVFWDGDVIEEVLGAFQAMQVLCNECDMSGSRVTASFPVAVLAGGAIGNMSENGDIVLEFLPPTDALGTRHVVAKDTESRFVMKVVARHKGTIFTLSTEPGQCYLAESDGDTWTLTLPQHSSSAVLNSTLPVLVTLLISRDRAISNDARMTVLCPVSQWTNASLHVFKPSQTYTNHVILVAHYSDITAGCLSVGGSELSTVAVPPLDNLVEGVGELSVVRVPLDKKVDHILLSCSSSCSLCKPFSGYVHGAGRNYNRGWAMPLGSCSRTSSQPSLQSDSILSQCSSMVAVAMPSTTPAMSPTPVSSATSVVELTSPGLAPSSVVPEITSTAAERFSSTLPSPSRAIETSYSGLAVSAELSNEVFSTSYMTSSEDGVFGSNIATQPDTTVTTVQTTTASDFPSTDPSTQATRTEAAGNMCQCLCQRHPTLPNATMPLPDYELRLLNETARQRNRKQSVPDHRLSATVIGSGGAVILVIVFLVIVCSDLTNLLGPLQGARVESRRGRGLRRST